MKIILSPSKLQTPFASDKELAKPLFFKKSEMVRGRLRAMSLAQISEFFKLKEAKAIEVYHLFQNEIEQFYSPFHLFSGIVFKEINYRSYDAIQLEYLERHAVILSAMYGLIEPDSALKPYRLDFTRKLEEIDLYQYWQAEVDTYFKDCPLIINLASKEYSKLLKNYKGRILNIFFQEEDVNGRLKTVTVRSKKMRGIMFDYLVQNCIEDSQQLKRFSENDYVFNRQLSTADDYYFIKEC